jgi:DNA invertase Pin-like site-specific DNA recombinase
MGASALCLSYLEAGCARIFSDTASGAQADRPELLRMLDYARAEDTIVVWRLDRLGRSLRNLVELVNELAERRIDLRSLQENIDTATPASRLIFHIFGSLAEFELELIRERTKAGLASARARRRIGGRRRLLTQAQVTVAKQMLASHQYGVGDVASSFNVSRSTLYRAIAEWRD